MFFQCAAFGLTGLLGLAGCGGGGGTDSGADVVVLEAGDTGGGTDVVTGDTGGGTDVVTGDTGGASGCMSYCTTIMANCTGANAQYASMDACLGSCGGFPAGAAGAQSGNSLACRTYHAGAAATGADVHCPHAGPTGAGVCGSPCESFCAIAQSACTGSNMQFADTAACMTACAMYATTPAYSTTTTSGNSFACRMYHLTVASSSAANAAIHCGHIVVNSPVCQ